MRSAIVETAMISESSIGIENKEIGRALGIVGFGDGLRLVVEKRKGKIVLDSQFAKSLRRVIGVGGRIIRADCHERDAFWLVMACDSQNLLPNVDHVRTMPADEHYDERPGLAQLRERDGFSSNDVRK